MKSFACGDVVAGCEARFVCRTEDELLAQMAVHALEAHGMRDIPASVVDSVRAHMVSV